jgi:hypothetical protein
LENKGIEGSSINALTCQVSRWEMSKSFIHCPTILNVTQEQQQQLYLLEYSYQHVLFMNPPCPESGAKLQAAPTHPECGGLPLELHL